MLSRKKLRNMRTAAASLCVHKSNHRRGMWPSERVNLIDRSAVATMYQVVSRPTSQRTFNLEILVSTQTNLNRLLHLIGVQ